MDAKKRDKDTPLTAGELAALAVLAVSVTALIAVEIAHIGSVSNFLGNLLAAAIALLGIAGVIGLFCFVSDILNRLGDRLVQGEARRNRGGEGG